MSTALPNTRTQAMKTAFVTSYLKLAVHLAEAADLITEHLVLKDTPQ